MYIWYDNTSTNRISLLYTHIALYVVYMKSPPPKLGGKRLPLPHTT